MKAVIFDFDGTIADSLLGVLEVFDMAHRRKVPLTTEDVEGFRQMSFFQIARKLKVPYWKLIGLGLFGRRMFSQHIELVDLYSGMKQLFIDLHKHGVAVYILSTNKPENIHAFLKMKDMDKCVQAVYGRAFFLNKSPKLRLLMRQTGLKKSDVVYVGDEIIDIRAAQSADVPIYAVSWGYTAKQALEARRPTKVVDTVNELRRLLID